MDVKVNAATHVVRLAAHQAFSAHELDPTMKAFALYAIAVHDRGSPGVNGWMSIKNDATHPRKSHCGKPKISGRATKKSLTYSQIGSHTRTRTPPTSMPPWTSAGEDAPE